MVACCDYFTMLGSISLKQWVMGQSTCLLERTDDFYGCNSFLSCGICLSRYVGFSGSKQTIFRDKLIHVLYKPIILDITYDRNIKMRFDMKRQIEMLETLKKPFVREYFC